nr:MAG TPA: hypothetical protein [Caudoviricetes sp.]
MINTLLSSLVIAPTYRYIKKVYAVVYFFMCSLGFSKELERK